MFPLLAEMCLFAKFTECRNTIITQMRIHVFRFQPTGDPLDQQRIDISKAAAGN